MCGKFAKSLCVKALRKIGIARKVGGSECPPMGEKLTKSPKVRYK